MERRQVGQRTKLRKLNRPENRTCLIAHAESLSKPHRVSGKLRTPTPTNIFFMISDQNEKIKVATNAVAALMDVSDCDLDYVLECLSGNVLSEEECFQIKEYFAF